MSFQYRKKPLQVYARIDPSNKGFIALSKFKDMFRTGGGAQATGEAQVTESACAHSYYSSDQVQEQG